MVKAAVTPLPAPALLLGSLQTHQPLWTVPLGLCVHLTSAQDSLGCFTVRLQVSGPPSPPPEQYFIQLVCGPGTDSTERGLKHGDSEGGVGPLVSPTVLVFP